MTRPVVFVHTNDQQMLGAKVSAHTFRKHSRDPSAFDVRLLRLEATPHLHRREGQPYLRMGRTATWRNSDLQSFSPLRRLVPQAMGWRGRALVTDPDVFSVGGDVLDLLTGDMHGKSVVCRRLPEDKGGGSGRWATSVMLLDCERLQDWRWDEEVDAMFEGRLDYKRWIQLADQDPQTIGELPETWNSFDRLEPDTKLLHTTERLTQPWKTGLPVDFNTNFQSLGGRVRRWLRAQGLLGAGRRYLPHPDPRQEAFFFAMLRECLEAGSVTEDELQAAIRSHDLRPDAWRLLEAQGWRQRVPA